MDTNRTASTSRIRSVGLLGVVVLCIALLAGCMTADQTAVKDAMNKDRTAQRLKALPEDATLNKKAQDWANKMAKENRLYHSNLQVGVPAGWCALGENVGYGGSIAAVQQGYMNSAGHRANILDKKWTHVGVGHAKNGSRVYTVQVFMKKC